MKENFLENLSKMLKQTTVNTDSDEKLVGKDCEVEHVQEADE